MSDSDEDGVPEDYVLPAEQAFANALHRLATSELEPTLRRLLVTARQQVHYRGSPALADLTLQVAKELEARDEAAAALPLFRESYAEFCALKGANSLMAALGASALAKCLTELSQHAEAGPLLEKALVVCRSHCTDEDEETLRALVLVAKSRIQLGNAGGAEPLLKGGQATLARLAAAEGLSPDGPPAGLVPEWAAVTEGLTQLLVQQGRGPEAKPLLFAALEALGPQPVAPPAAWQLAELGQLLVPLLDCSADLVRGEALYRRLLRPLGCRRRSVANCLGHVLRKRGLPEQAAAYVDRYGQTVAAGGERDSTLDAQAVSWLEDRMRTCAQCGPVVKELHHVQLCSGCRSVRYCGPACQKLHWQAHKAECRRIQAENEKNAAESGAAGPSTAGGTGLAGE